MPNFELMLAYENDAISDDDLITLFQEIYDTQAYTWLQGCYGRFLRHLIEEGYINTGN